MRKSRVRVSNRREDGEKQQRYDFFPKDDFFSSLVFSSKGVVSSRPYDFSAKTIVTERCRSSRRRGSFQEVLKVCVGAGALTQIQAGKEIFCDLSFYSVGFLMLVSFLGFQFLEREKKKTLVILFTHARKKKKRYHKTQIKR